MRGSLPTTSLEGEQRRTNGTENRLSERDSEEAWDSRVYSVPERVHRCFHCAKSEGTTKDRHQYRMSKMAREARPEPVEIYIQY